MIPPSACDRFLAEAGWHGARVEPLAGDASFRRYFRVTHPAHGAAVLMDAPPPHEDPRPFIAVAEWLVGLGLSAPDILARDLDAGLLLLADFGDIRLRETLDQAPDGEMKFYGLATDLLAELHRHPPMAGLPPHGLSEWLSELELFTNWYAPAVGIEVDHTSYVRAWEEVLAPVAHDGLGPVTVLRDYHAENIMLVSGRDGIAHLGLLDFQDARAGHPAYDLASILEDARRDVSREVEQAMLDRYVAVCDEGEAFRRAYWTLAAQRNTRILGVFCRLWKRDGKPGYKRFQPRMWGLLERDLTAPHLAPVKQWFDTNVPQEARIAPWLEAANG
jgi:aminoglycoside/choline kinase family phosphotransferase